MGNDNEGKSPPKATPKRAAKRQTAAGALRALRKQRALQEVEENTFPLMPGPVPAPTLTPRRVVLVPKTTIVPADKSPVEETRVASPGMARIDAWFASGDWQPFAFQRKVWSAYLQGGSGLIHSATGSGKTLAAWLGPVAELIDAGTAPPPLSVLWITPMRALSADTCESLLAPITAMHLDITVGVRTGDTTSAERTRQAKKMPTALITTPESLSLMLSQPDARETFPHLRAVIVDEWHELMGTKRGVQTELALARLRIWRPLMRVWGLSATLGNLEMAAQVLLGPSHTAQHTATYIVEGVQDKRILIDTLIPQQAEKFPWAGHLGFAMLDDVVREIEKSGTTLVFTNVRSQAELWYQALLEAKPEWAGELALHHGSLDHEVRAYVERGLKAGTLRAVVATSSLDLGVDFSPVRRVLQIGSAKGVARLLQRAGRSGHSPGAMSRVTLVPSHAFEFIEAAAARRAARAKQVESRRPIEKPLDVLIQHLVTIAAGEGFVPDALLREVRGSYAYRDLTDEEWGWALDFVVKGGEALRAYPEYRKVIEHGGEFRVADQAIARRHRMSIGTIVSDASMDVRYQNGSRLGHVEESFVARLSPGDAFNFAGRALELVRVRDMTAYVKPATARRRVVPQWGGSKMPFSAELAHATRQMLQAFRDDTAGEPEIAVVARLLAVQQKVSRVPSLKELLIEQVETREGHHLFFYPFAGRHVHLGLGALFGFRLGLIKPATFSFSVNDYGFELLSETPFTLSREALSKLFSTENLLADVLKSLNAAELSKRHFREIARVAGLVFQGFPGANKSNRQVQATSGLIFDVFAQWDKENPLLGQAEREVLQRELEFQRLRETLQDIQTQSVMVMRPPHPTPFCFPLMVERFSEKLSSEKLSDRIQRMQLVFDRDAK
jgi:ATP-dependent helicase Lhr and Lhr-like helicase